MNILPHAVNRFNGIEINTDELPDDAAVFEQDLSASLVKWVQDGRFLIWLHLPIERAALIPVSTAAGFVFHHTEPNYVLLVRKMQEDALVPGYATHYIGAGGVVINERRELLVVSERHRSSARPYYKLPGGGLHPGEHLAAAAVREVYEETGVETRFGGRGLLAALARLPLRQVGHLLHLPAVTADRGDRTRRLGDR